jgi:hypothetical protein
MGRASRGKRERRHGAQQLGEERLVLDLAGGWEMIQSADRLLLLDHVTERARTRLQAEGRDLDHVGLDAVASEIERTSERLGAATARDARVLAAFVGGGGDA